MAGKVNPLSYINFQNPYKHEEEMNDFVCETIAGKLNTFFCINFRTLTKTYYW
jgi:hypothetical protein